MTILQALSGYYQRLADRGEAELPGFSREKISFAVVIDRDGNVLDVADLRVHGGKRPLPSQRDVPTAVKRTVAVVPFFLWDKTAYSLGVTAGEGKRTAQEHQSFRELHAQLLAPCEGEGLVALRNFLESWSPERFQEPPFSPEMLDTNIVFRLDGDDGPDGKPRFIHERPAAQPLIDSRAAQGESGFCLVSGAETAIERLHPTIRGVDGAQSSGAALVSFNLDSFQSYGLEQGANAPTGQAAAFRYGAALNRLLDRAAGQRLRIGDTTTVFWADTSVSGETMAAAAEEWMAAVLGDPARDTDFDPQEAAKLRDALTPLSEGRPVTIGTEQLHPETLIHILGLAPNAARLSVRFWLTQDLGALAANLARHERDCKVEPPPRLWGAAPSINRLLVKTVSAQEKWENIPPLLAGEVARAIFSGGRYPRTLLSSAIMRLRAGDDAGSGWHAAAIRAVLQRLDKKGAPMSLDKEERNPAYRLGRLFAVLEAAQYNALGRVNATIRDRYFGAASATPATVFPLLLRGGQNHLATLRKDGKAGGLERDLEEIIADLGTELPRSLRLEDQGRFAIGYYHQRAARFTRKDEAADEQGNQDA